MVSFLPCLAMEKEKSLTDADKALLKAAHENNNAGIIEALNNGAHVNIQDQDGNTALHYAMRHGNFGMFNILDKAYASPFTLNNYQKWPLVYLNHHKTNFLNQFLIVYSTLDSVLGDEIYLHLKKNKQINAQDFDKKPIKEIFSFYASTIGKHEKNFTSDFYEEFSAFIGNFILTELGEITDKKIQKEESIDPWLSFSNLSAAQKKASHLLQTVKLMNCCADSLIGKPLTTGKKFYDGLSLNAKEFTKWKSTQLIAIYFGKLQSIIEDPKGYYDEMDRLLYFADQQDEESKTPQITKIPLYNLLDTPEDQQRSNYIVANAPKSAIKPEQFALAFTAFARLRK